MNAATLTVTQLNRYVKAMFEENRLLSRIYVKGEISNLTNHFASGHVYFSLKDAGACVKAVMFKSYAQGLLFAPQNGQTVVVCASASVYERDGLYQLYVYEMQPDGLGAQALAFLQLKEKLEREGLFAPEHKRPLPRMPLRVGVITSKTGAALQDILNILGRRWPAATAVVAPVQVQGAGAAASVARALRRMNEQSACDVIILGRGGGSAEDLSAFNDEALAREIYASSIPVVSAVGHETDFTIADFVADLRAPTPSAAAELVSPDVRDLLYRAGQAQRRLEDAVLERLGALAARLSAHKSHRALQGPGAAVAQKQARLAASSAALNTTMHGRLERAGARLSAQVQQLQALSPLGVLARGYAIAFAQGKPLVASRDVAVGDFITVQLAKGGLCAQVTEKMGG